MGGWATKVFSWGIYVTGSVRDAAFREAGLPLEYYRNYVTGFNRPHRFFHSLSDLDGEDFLLCNDSTTYGDDFTNARLWANYVQWTGDTDGVIETSGGYVAKCPDGRFWLSPACRGNSSECIPVLSAFATLANMLQWATVHSLPFAIGRPPNFPKFLDLARTYDVLFYYWEPDDTLALADLQVSRLVLPPNNVAEYKEGNFRTAAAPWFIYLNGNCSIGYMTPHFSGSCRPQGRHQLVQVRKLFAGALCTSSEGIGSRDRNQRSCHMESGHLNLYGTGPRAWGRLLYESVGSPQADVRVGEVEPRRAQL